VGNFGNCEPSAKTNVTMCEGKWFSRDISGAQQIDKKIALTPYSIFIEPNPSDAQMGPCNKMGLMRSAFFTTALVDQN